MPSNARCFRRAATALLIVGLATIAGWFAWIQLIDPRYRSEAKIMCWFYELPPSSIGRGPMRDSNRIGRLVETELEKQISAETLRAAVAWPSVRMTPWMRSHGNDVDAAAADLKQRLIARPQPNSTLYHLDLALPGPHDAQTVLEALTTVYTNLRSVDHAARLHAWFSQYLQAEPEIDELLARLAQLAESDEPVSIKAATPSVEQQLETLTRELFEAWRHQREIRQTLAAAGAQSPSWSEMTRIRQAVPPTEGRRIWWRWPWD